VRLACEARDDFWGEEKFREGRVRPLVAASAGSYGAFRADGSEYSGDYELSKAQLIEFHRRRLEILLDTDADLIAFETIPSLMEGEAVIRLLEGYPESRAWLSFSCCDGERVCHGELFRKCVALANQSEHVEAIGLNCTPPRFAEALLESARGVTEKYLIAYPNSGEGWDAERRSWTDTRTKDFGGMSRLWHRAGARLIGGCCRTTPEDIRNIAQEFGFAGRVPPD
jgi:homocysteine S-methyltransferase